MVSKFKKITAAVLVAVLTVSAVQTAHNIYATSLTDDTADAAADDTAAAGDDTASTDDASADKEEKDTSSGAEANGETVNENGEVVMQDAIGKKKKSEWITMDDYDKVAESETYNMYLYKPRMSVILENKKTGRLIESTLSDEKDDGYSNEAWLAYMQSGIVATAIQGTNNTYQLDLQMTENEIKYDMADDGFTAHISWPTWGISLDVVVSLSDDDQLVVTVPDDSVKETEKDKYISTVSLFPFMGYSYLDDNDGYMLIPDGNGALINLDNKEGRYTTGFSQLIYGADKGFDETEAETLLWDKISTVKDANEVTAPIFGMAHTDDQEGYLAIVEQGDKRAYIEAQPNGVMVNYNRCYARFLLRDIYVQPLNQSNSGTVTNVESDRTHSDLSVRYILLDGDDADYMGMANAYRTYLIDNGLVRTDLDTSYNTRVDFLGTDREKFLFGTRAVTMTTIDDITDIFNTLQTDGVSSLLSVYDGWQKGGVYNVPVSKFKTDRHIGSNREMSDLINNSKKSGYNLYLSDNALLVNSDTNATTFSVAKLVNKRTLKIETHDEVYDLFYYLLPDRSENNVENLAKALNNSDISNIALSGITNTLFTYTSKGKSYTRIDTADSYSRAVDSVDGNNSLAMEKPYAFMWKNTDSILDMPLGSSKYMYIDEEVPFLSIVLKGIIPMYSDYVNFEADKQEFFLQMIESGVYPSFYITKEDSSKLIYTNSNDKYSTKFDTYEDTIVDYDKQLRAVAEKTSGAMITDHEKLDNDVVKVTYDNGVIIYVNYSDESRTADGINIDAMSYSIGGSQ